MTETDDASAIRASSSTDAIAQFWCTTTIARGHVAAIAARAAAGSRQRLSAETSTGTGIAPTLMTADATAAHVNAGTRTRSSGRTPTASNDIRSAADPLETGTQCAWPYRSASRRPTSRSSVGTGGEGLVRVQRPEAMTPASRSRVAPSATGHGAQGRVRTGVPPKRARHSSGIQDHAGASLDVPDHPESCSQKLVDVLLGDGSHQ